MIKTDLHIDEFFMKRCLQLAKLGKGHTAPNPLVGAVLVYEGKIIGEGYHQYLGGPHAEVNCINNVSEKDRKFIEAATLYVSLEPCTHFGKTPPCSDLIIQQNIKEVVIGCSDNFKEVNGKGIEKLKAAGVNVKTNVLEIECRKINQHFFLFNEQQRPFIILKWAETKDKKIAIRHGERLFISNEFTNRLVHQWRSETAAILIGTNTALLDNPALNNRLWTGANLVRLLLDMHLRLPTDLNVFNATQKTIVFNIVKHETVDNICYHKINEDESIVQQISKACYQLEIQSILVEGGAKLLQTFIDENVWDEARIITNETLNIGHGLAAPVLNNATLVNTEKISTDTISYFTNS